MAWKQNDVVQIHPESTHPGAGCKAIINKVYAGQHPGTNRYVCTYQQGGRTLHDEFREKELKGYDDIKESDLDKARGTALDDLSHLSRHPDSAKLLLRHGFRITKMPERHDELWEKPDHSVEIEKNGHWCHLEHDPDYDDRDASDYYGKDHKDLEKHLNQHFKQNESVDNIFDAAVRRLRILRPHQSETDYKACLDGSHSLACNPNAPMAHRIEALHHMDRALGEEPSEPPSEADVHEYTNLMKESMVDQDDEDEFKKAQSRATYVRKGRLHISGKPVVDHYNCPECNPEDDDSADDDCRLCDGTGTVLDVKDADLNESFHSEDPHGYYLQMSAHHHEKATQTSHLNDPVVHKHHAELAAKFYNKALKAKKPVRESNSMIKSILARDLVGFKDDFEAALYEAAQLTIQDAKRQRLESKGFFTQPTIKFFEAKLKDYTVTEEKGESIITHKTTGEKWVYDGKNLKK